MAAGMKDHELLTEYAQRRSPGALEEIVRRHVATRTALDNIRAQTGIKLAVEPHIGPVWVAEPVE